MSLQALLLFLLMRLSMVSIAEANSFIDSSINALPMILTNGGVYSIAFNGTALSKTRISGRCNVSLTSFQYTTLVSVVIPAVDINSTANEHITTTLPFLPKSLSCPDNSFVFALFNDEIPNDNSPLAITNRFFSLKNVTWFLDQTDECNSNCFRNVSHTCRDTDNDPHLDSVCTVLYGQKPPSIRACLGGICPTQTITALYPTEGSVFLIGSRLHVNWTTTGTNFVAVSIAFYSSSTEERLFGLTANSPNNGYFTFIPSIASLEKYANQKVFLLIRNENKAAISARTGTFTLIPGPERFTYVSQSNGNTASGGIFYYYSGVNITLTYSSQFIPLVNIYLRYQLSGESILLAANQTTSTFANIQRFLLTPALVRASETRASIFLCHAFNSTFCVTSTNVPSFLMSPVYWQSGNYDTCLSSCVATRPVRCFPNQTQPFYVIDDYLCINSVGEKPPVNTSCTGGQCVRAFSSLSIMQNNTATQLGDFTVGVVYYSQVSVIGPISLVSFWLIYDGSVDIPIFLGNATVFSSSARMYFTINRTWIRNGVKVFITANDETLSIKYNSSSYNIYDVYWQKVYQTSYCPLECKRSLGAVCRRMITNENVTDSACFTSGLSRPASAEDCLGGYCERPITVASPSSQSVLLRGTTYPIKWTTNGSIALINIRVCSAVTGSNCPITVQSNIGNSGSYDWVIRSEEEIFNNRHIRIEDAADGNNVYWSSNAFNLVATKGLNITRMMNAPWKIGNTVTINGSPVGVSRIKVVLSPIISGSFNEIENIPFLSLNANDFEYSFSLSLQKYSVAVNHMAVIRVIDLDSSILYDSDCFTVSPQSISFSTSTIPSFIIILSLFAVVGCYY